MSKDSFNIQIKDKELTTLLRTMQKRGQDAKPAFTAIAGTLKTDIDMNFRRSGSYGDIFTTGISSTLTKWKPLSALTKMNRPKGKILQASGALRASIGTVRQITSKSLTYGTNYEFAATQHFGATIKPKRAKKLAIPIGHNKRVSSFNPDTLVFTPGAIYRKSDRVKLFVRAKQVTIPARAFLTPSPRGIENMTKILAAFLLKGNPK